MKLNQKGFSAIHLVLMLVIAGLIGFTGWYVWNNNKDSKTATTTNSKSETATKETTETGPYAGWKKDCSDGHYGGICLRFPSEWGKDGDTSDPQHGSYIYDSPTGRVEVNYSNNASTAGASKYDQEVTVKSITKASSSSLEVVQYIARITKSPYKNDHDVIIGKYLACVQVVDSANNPFNDTMKNSKMNLSICGNTFTNPKVDSLQSMATVSAHQGYKDSTVPDYYYSSEKIAQDWLDSAEVKEGVKVLESMRAY